ncbi:MAG: ComEC/Rec2 family competence protein [Bryobacteraceae bacterium]
MRRRAHLFLLLVACLVSCTRRAPVAPVGTGVRVTFFDVGQGDAALVRTPEGNAVLIDTGKGPDTAGLLAAEGVSRLDLLIVSHPHADHEGGLEAVLRAFPVSEVWYAGRFRGRARKLLETHGARPVAAGAGKQLGRLALTVLHPQPGVVLDGVNNNSLVVKAAYNGHRYLFPGDCELGCWEQLFKRRRPELRSDVLKAAHHGSGNGTNSGVLGNVRPSTVVISCGRDNNYGHPHPLVLKLIGRLGAKLFRTDQQGAIRCAGVECAAR